MTWQPMLVAPVAVQIHAAAAVAAFMLGLLQFAAAKGTPPHRLLGWVLVGLMVALSSF